MTPKERAQRACGKDGAGLCGLEFDVVVEHVSRSIGAALRERDAAHEIALAKAHSEGRAAGLREAAQEAVSVAADHEKAWGLANADKDYLAEKLNYWAVDACRHVARRIRALLEEAGK